MTIVQALPVAIMLLGSLICIIVFGIRGYRLYKKGATVLLSIWSFIWPVVLWVIISPIVIALASTVIRMIVESFI